MTEQPSSDPQPEVPDSTPAPELAAAPSPTAKKPKCDGPFTWGTGRRKAAVARVRIRPGTGEFLINKREVKDFFRIDRDQAAAMRPLEVTDTMKDFDIYVNIVGGGITGQSGAVLLGLARALVKANGDFEPKLREFNLLRRDPRRVERKKYGQRGARRRFQFSKR